jgi:hypothetical protein
MDQALILEVADLRDRDVREVVAELIAHGPDVEQTVTRGRLGRCAH